jgi:hypothetical protein
MTDRVVIKEDYDDDYKKIMLHSSVTRRASYTVLFDESLLRPVYPNTLPVSTSKKNDLVKLCTAGVIKSKYHAFYKGLVTTDTIKECLSQPDCTELSQSDNE